MVCWIALPLGRWCAGSLVRRFDKLTGDIHKQNRKNAHKNRLKMSGIARVSFCQTYAPAPQWVVLRAPLGHVTRSIGFAPVGSCYAPHWVRWCWSIGFAGPGASPYAASMRPGRRWCSPYAGGPAGQRCGGPGGRAPAGAAVAVAGGDSPTHSPCETENPMGN